MGKLTETKIRHLKPTDKEQRLNDGAGLYLRIRPGGSRNWIIRRKSNGKTQIITLGQYPAISLKQARLQAAQYQMKGEVSGSTVEELVKRYMQRVVEPSYRRPDIPQGYMDRAILPALGRRKVRDVTRAECVRVIEDYATRRGRHREPATRSAEQVRSILRKLFSYAVEIGWLDSSPVTEVTRRVSGYTSRPRSRVLSDDEIHRVWHSDHQNAPILRFLLLTGLRIGEAWHGYQDESRWIVPEELSKSGAGHWVHLPQSALLQLPLPATSMRNLQQWVKVWQDSEPGNEYTPHDLRRTFVTRLNEIGIMPHIAEKCVNHRLTGVLAVYNRAEYEAERVEAAERLEQHILEVANG